jgi:hypothetical protein
LISAIGAAVCRFSSPPNAMSTSCLTKGEL